MFLHTINYYKTKIIFRKIKYIKIYVPKMYKLLHKATKYFRKKLVK